MSKDMKLLMENWRGFLNEAETQAAANGDANADKAAQQIAQLFAAKVKEIAPQVKSQIQAKQPQAQAEKKPLEEVGTLLLAGIVLALPAIFKTFGYIYDYVNKTQNFSNPNMFFKASEKLHHTYENIFEGALMAIPGFSTFPEFRRKKIVKVVMIGLTAYFAIHSGHGVLEAAKEANTVLAGQEAALTALKAEEVLKFMTLAVRGIASETSGAA